MKWSRLPPAGDRILWQRGARDVLRGMFAPWHLNLVGSGTQALAALLSVLRGASPERDEVIFAAYNCPALVSATVFAGARPVLVDYEHERPWMDLRQLEERLSTRTLAVIGVDFLGTFERYRPLRALCERVGCTLIQDSAQAFPSRTGERAWQGDAVVLSFGRGKPVSLLSGGAVLSRNRGLSESIARLLVPARFDEVQHRLAIKAYNLLRRPGLYRVPASVPGLRLGETRFIPLDGITAMPDGLEEHLAPAISSFRRRRGPEPIYPSLLSGTGLQDVAVACSHPRDERLSRYPVLAPDERVRDALYGALTPMGASRMYGVTLPKVPGVAAHLAETGVFPRAEEFAARLLTLPTHDGATPQHLWRMAPHLRVKGGEAAYAEAKG